MVDLERLGRHNPAVTISRRRFLGGAGSATGSLLLTTRSLSAGRELYFDPSAEEDGDGSFAAPWNKFGYLSYLKGDLNGLKVRIRSGTVATHPFHIERAWNFTVEVFGGSLSPIVDGSVPIAASSWIKEGPLYYIESPTHHAIFIAEQRLARVSSKEELSGSSVQWFDESSKRIYIHLEGERPGDQCRRTNMYYCVQFADCNNFLVEGLEVKAASDSGIILNSYDGGLGDAVISECAARMCGSYASTAGDSFLLWGKSAEEKSRGIVLRDCESHNPINCGFELNWLQDFILVGNLEDGGGTSVELYRSCTGGRIERNLLRRTVPRVGFGTGAGIWLASTGAEAGRGGHGAIRISANVICNTARQALDLQSGTEHVITNNTFYHCGGSASVVNVEKGGVDDVGVTLTNNIVQNPNSAPYNWHVKGVPAERVFSDFNVFFGGAPHFKFGDQYCADLSAWRAVSGQDFNSRVGDPGLSDPLSGDFRIKPGGGAQGAGAVPYAPLVDYEGKRYADPPNAGAFA